MLQDQAQCILGDYVRGRYPRQPTRFGRLLLAIPLLRMIRPATAEAFFFRDTVGDTSVRQLVADMYGAAANLNDPQSGIALAKEEVEEEEDLDTVDVEEDEDSDKAVST